MSIIGTILLVVVCALAAGLGAGAYVARKLRGERSWREVITILGGGPGNPTKPV